MLLERGVMHGADKSSVFFLGEVVKLGLHLVHRTLSCDDGSWPMPLVAQMHSTLDRIDFPAQL